MAAAFLRSLLFLLVSKCIVVEGLPVPSPQHKAPGDRAELEQLQEAARSFREEREVCPLLSIKPGVPLLRGTLVLYNSFSLPSTCVTEPASSYLVGVFLWLWHAPLLIWESRVLWWGAVRVRNGRDSSLPCFHSVIARMCWRAMPAELSERGCAALTSVPHVAVPHGLRARSA